ncbi:MAG: prepilin-type N-terminal cleavage/methylation domain-containing protein [Clostridia bacterium]|nr:prepilin-type N-terminal cleavage/methylation domain-containing protein [Clostridia bacterium]
MKALEKAAGHKGGMTLIEVVVSMALLSIVMVFICSTCLFIIQMFARSASQGKNSMDAAGGVDLKTANPAVTTYDNGKATMGNNDGTFVITFGAQPPVTVNGSYVSGTDTNNNQTVTYKSFVPAP